MKPLRVNVAGLQQVGGHLDALATRLGATAGNSSDSLGASWQSSVAEAATTRSEAGRQRDAFAGRVRATATKVAAAGRAYRGSDAHSATTLDAQLV